MMDEVKVLHNISEPALSNAVKNAKRLYKRKTDRLTYIRMCFGENSISNPDVFYYTYFGGSYYVPK